MQNFESNATTVIELHFFMKKMRMKIRRKRICENHIYLYFIPHMTFHSVRKRICVKLYFIPHMTFSVTFLHVLHLDVLRGQIEIETESVTNISLCMAVMLDHPWQSLYYRTACVYTCATDELCAVSQYYM